jgi:membrane-associated phospholipid phosphatase
MSRDAVSPPPRPSLLVPDPDRAQQTPRNLKRAAVVVAGGYVVLLLSMLAIGFALTHLDSSVGRWDESVNRWFANHRTPTWNSITGVATWFVNTLPAIGLAIVITVVLALRSRWREAMMLWIALPLELLVFLSVTFVVARPRPHVVRLDSAPATSSFPSGHTAAATVIFAGLAIIVLCCTGRSMVRVLAFIFGVLAATAIGFARVYRGLHHPTDVVFGALLGAGALCVAIVAVRATAVRKTDETAERRAPEAVGGAVAVSIDPVGAARYEPDLRRTAG